MLTSLALRHWLLVVALLLVPLLGAAPPEDGPKVYLLRMKNGFDLHLANRLTESGLLTVVTDAQQAEYILTETVGPGFEETMRELYPPRDEEAESVEVETESATPEVRVGQGLRSRASSFGKASGMVFLVRRTDATVVWSTFLDRRDTRETMLHKNAGNVVKRLKKWAADTASLHASVVP